MLEIARKRERSRRANATPEERQQRLETNAAAMGNTMANETPEERAARLARYLAAGHKRKPEERRTATSILNRECWYWPTKAAAAKRAARGEGHRWHRAPRAADWRGELVENSSCCPALKMKASASAVDVSSRKVHHVLPVWLQTVVDRKPEVEEAASVDAEVAHDAMASANLQTEPVRAAECHACKPFQPLSGVMKPRNSAPLPCCAQGTGWSQRQLRGREKESEERGNGSSGEECAGRSNESGSTMVKRDYTRRPVPVTDVWRTPVPVVVTTTEEDMSDPAELRPGDYIIAVADVHRPRPPIWRIEGQTVLQRFEMIQAGKETLLYRNSSSFSTWNPLEQSKYANISVRVHSNSQSATVVQVLEIHASPNSSLANMANRNGGRQASVGGGAALELHNLEDKFEMDLQTADGEKMRRCPAVHVTNLPYKGAEAVKDDAALAAVTGRDVMVVKKKATTQPCKEFSVPSTRPEAAPAVGGISTRKKRRYLCKKRTTKSTGTSTSSPHIRSYPSVSTQTEVCAQADRVTQTARIIVSTETQT
ncbi:hypothetical protein V5799_024214 [Amblyomma americanum]|uniref:Uncharacterized protein n=1 Tax=Amblyomma americanum TaxID=6943 RepID=A0AAQ4ED43_AMBAM